MRNFPIFLNMDGARVVIIGGGEQAAQKLRLIGRTTAAITVMAEAMCGELESAVAQGRIIHHPAILDASLLAGARLVIIATGCAALDAAAADLARQQGAVVNVVDRPAISDFITPAIVDRDPVVVAIGTEGTAPVLARQIKTALESMLEPGLGRFAALAGRLRDRVAHRIAPSDRRRFWEWAMDLPRRLATSGREAEAIAHLDQVLSSGHVPAPRQRAVSVIDAAAEPDLLSLRAVGRLQRADLILHGADCSSDILELARRDAEREILSTEPGPAQWQADRDARRAAAAVEDGHQVVWIGNAVNASAALDRAGVTYEIIPVASATEPSDTQPSAVVARAKEG
ncbi:MAG: NAD(P)-dependent oxidoreductase [Pseudomonadota bacterium]